MKKIVCLIILNIALVIGVGAQKSVARKQVSAAKSQLQMLQASEQTVFTFSGVQMAPGVLDEMNQMFRGNTFVLNGGMDQFSTHLNISMEYTVDPTNPNKHLICSGKWTLVVYDSGIYTGVIFGDIANGEINWMQDPETMEVSVRQTAAQLRIVGGTDEYSDLTPDPTEYPFTETTQLLKGSTIATLAF